MNLDDKLINFLPIITNQRQDLSDMHNDGVWTEAASNKESTIQQRRMAIPLGIITLPMMIRERTENGVTFSADKDGQASPRMPLNPKFCSL